MVAVRARVRARVRVSVMVVVKAKIRAKVRIQVTVTVADHVHDCTANIHRKSPDPKLRRKNDCKCGPVIMI